MNGQKKEINGKFKMGNYTLSTLFGNCTPIKQFKKRKEKERKEERKKKGKEGRKERKKDGEWFNKAKKVEVGGRQEAKMDCKENMRYSPRSTIFRIAIIQKSIKWRTVQQLPSQKNIHAL